MSVEIAHTVYSRRVHVVLCTQNNVYCIVHDMSTQYNMYSTTVHGRVLCWHCLHKSTFVHLFFFLGGGIDRQTDIVVYREIALSNILQHIGIMHHYQR